MKKIYSFFGDFYHDHDIILSAVEKAVKGIENLELIDAKIEQISQVLDQNPEAIIIDMENRINPQDPVIDLWLTPELDEKITNYVHGGGRFVAMHAGIASYAPETKYTKMLKGYFLSHPADCPVQYISNDKLPFENKTAFNYQVMDEHYQLHVDEENTTVFMKSTSEHGDNYGGWYHDYGNGKVICIAPTHRKEGFEHEETIRLIKQSIEWVIGKN